PIGERQTLDLEAQLTLSGLAAPAELAEILLSRGQELASVVAYLVLQARRRQRRGGDESQAHADRLAGEELVAAPSVAFAVHQLGLGDPHLAATPLAQPRT